MLQFRHNLNTGVIYLPSGVAGNYVAAILLANLPQQVLSLCYFAYNAMFTRICAEKEWSSYSLSYKPLRVTAPKGKQVSTYRLQLPYIYSIPLLTASVALHWLVSNAIYMFISEGGMLFFNTSRRFSVAL